MESSGSRNPIEQLADEFIRRRRQGERPTVEEYARTHPEHADEIRELFPTLEMMEHVRSEVDGDDDVHSGKQVGDQVGDFHLIREIGRGGMGVVFEARQQSLNRRVALKLLAPHLTRSRNYLERFERESRAAANLQHANIVPVFGVGEEAGVHYFVMQYVHGRGLDQVLHALRTGKILATNSVASLDRTEVGELAIALATGNWHANDTGLFDLQSRKLVHTLPIGLTLVSFTPDGRFLMCGSANYEVGTWKKSQLEPTDQSLDYGATVFAKAAGLAFISKRYPADGVFAYDLQDWRHVAQLETHRNDIIAEAPMAVTPDGSRLANSQLERSNAALGYEGFQITQWDVRRLREQLKEMGLDFDCKPLPAEVELPPITEVTVDFGEYE